MDVDAVEVERRRVASFETFYSEQRLSAARLAWLLSHDSAIAEDVAHDAFAAVFARYGSLNDPVAYLRRVIVNAVFERARRQGREHRRLVLIAAGTEPTSEGPTGGLTDVIARLPSKQRTAVVLRFWADMTDIEIADAMSMRPSSVRSLLSRSIKQLRKEVRP